LKFGVAPSFSECAPTSVASTSTTTDPVAANGERWPHTLARAAARAPRIAAITAAESTPKASISRLIDGSDATAPNNCG
jgi:hypothetical protein